MLGVALIILSSHRQKLHKSHDDILLILTRLPLPVIVSDAHGTILFLNDRAANLLNIPRREAIGRSYFQLLLHENGKGANIQKYVELIESKCAEAIDINLRIQDNSTQLLKGMLVGVDPEEGRQIVTMIV